MTLARHLFAAAALAAAAGCATSVAPRPEAITVHAGPCFGARPIFTVTVADDGATRFIGHRFTGMDGDHALPADAGLFRDLAAAIAARQSAWPDGDIVAGDPDRCGMAPTDMPTYAVEVAPEGAGPRFAVYAGCPSEEARKAMDLVADLMQVLEAHGAPIRPEDAERG